MPRCCSAVITSDALYKPTDKVIKSGRDPIIRLSERVIGKYEENYDALGGYYSLRNNAVIRAVFGYCQRFAPINFMQAFAMGIYYIVQDKEKLTRSFEYRDWEEHFILPLDSNPALGLGHEYLAGPKGLSAAMAYKTFCQSKTKKLNKRKFMKKFYTLGACILVCSALNAYAITAQPLAPVDFTNAIPNEWPILLPQDPKHFLIYTKGEITLVNTIKNNVEGTLSKPNAYENLQALIALQNGKLLALDATGLYTSQDLGKHWRKTSENIFELDHYSPRILQNKTHPQNLFIVTESKIFLSHDEGHSWQVLWQEKPFNVNCHTFEILQTMDGNIYIVTHHGKIQVTHDEGQNWKELSNPPIPSEPEYWIYKKFCSSEGSNKGYLRLGQQIFEIKSPQEIKLVYEDKDNSTKGCFVDNQHNLYVTTRDKAETKTNIFFLDQDFKKILVNSLQGQVYSFIQDSEGKNYLNTSFGLATAQTLNSSILPHPAIFKQGLIHELSVNNETDFTATAGYHFQRDLFETYLSQDGGSRYTHLSKKYYELFYFKGALSYLVRCNSQLCFNTSKDNGKTWELVELPKEIKDLYTIDSDRGLLILNTYQGFFLSSDLENWNAILTEDFSRSTQWATVLKKHKPLYISSLKEKQNTPPRKVKNLKAFSAPHTDCPFFNLEVNISPSHSFTLLQHGCRDDDDIYLSKDEGAHWERAHSNLPSSVLDSPFHVQNVFLENGDLILVDYNGNSLQKSSDGGVHFKNLINNLPLKLVGKNIFAHSGNTLFAIGSIYGKGIYFSRNAGDTWEHLNIINSETFDLQFANNKLFFVTTEDGIFSTQF